MHNLIVERSAVCFYSTHYTNSGSVVLSAGYEVTAAITGDVTVDVGVTGIDADNFIDGATLAAATAVGTYAQQAAAFQPIILQSADTLDVLIATSTTAISAGLS